MCCSCEPPAAAAAPPPFGRERVPLEDSYLGASYATDVTERFAITGEVLGQGAFATARAAVERATGRRAAVKSIHKRRLAGLNREWANVRREVQVMHLLSGHPAAVELLGAWEDHEYIHLAMDLCEGGCVLERVIERGPYTEREAAAAVRQLLEIVTLAHDMGCVHRDIKLDNLLLADDSGRGSAIRLVDWGFSTFLRPGEKLRGICGTSFYIAPEVLLGPYDERADVWSCGVVLYVLLCGRPPFSGGRNEAIFRDIIDNGVPDMTGAPWDGISAGAKDAVRRMMTWHASRRPSAREMLSHEWVRAGGPGASRLAPKAAPPLQELLTRLRAFAAAPPLKRLAARAVAAGLCEDRARGLAELYEAMSAGGPDGGIGREDLKRGLQQRGAALEEGELYTLFAAADADCDGVLSFEEFAAALLHPSRLEDEATLLHAFKHLDRDCSGHVSRDELAEALREAGWGGSCGGRGGAGPDGLAADIVAAADQDGDGELDYEEFVFAVAGPSEAPPAAPSPPSSGASSRADCRLSGAASGAASAGAGGGAATPERGGSGSLDGLDPLGSPDLLRAAVLSAFKQGAGGGGGCGAARLLDGNQRACSAY